MNEQIEENTIQTEPIKEKKQRKESLLFKYGIIAFLEILAFISVFLIFMSRNIKAPINRKTIKNNSSDSAISGKKTINNPVMIAARIIPTISSLILIVLRRILKSVMLLSILKTPIKLF